jgi:hypothetical protein
MKVLVTDPISDAGLDVVRDAGHEVVTDYELEGSDLLDAVADANALIVRSGTEVTAEVLEAAPDLVIVGRDQHATQAAGTEGGSDRPAHERRPTEQMKILAWDPLGSASRGNDADNCLRIAHVPCSTPTA